MISMRLLAISLAAFFSAAAQAEPTPVKVLTGPH